MRRREGLALWWAARAMLAGPWAGLARAQAPQGGKLRRVGVLAPSTAEREAVTLKPFFEEMQRLGWIEGQSVVFDRAYALDQYQDLPRLALELVARKPELIYAPPLPAALAARKATTTIPVVFATGTDPVGVGLVRSLAQPGGNATGMISVIDSLAPKSLELLLQLLPGLRCLGLLGDAADPRLGQDRDALAPLVAARRIQLVVAGPSEPRSFDAAVARLLRDRVDAIMTNSSLSFNLRERLIEQLRGRPVAVVGHRRELVDAGALFSYGAALHDQIRRSALVVDKILRGARPQDIPVEQPTLFELVLNLKTARQLGISVPQAMLLQANQVIE
jgi:putative tryptophan/tyrosine transport system substrate-binding protein